MFKKIKEYVKNLKQEIVPVYFVLFDKRTPVLAKIFAAVTVGYLLSPIDLIPDFIPVLGLLDDFFIVPLLIKLTLNLIPKTVIEEIKATSETKQLPKPRWFYALPMIALYIYLLYRYYWFLMKIDVET